LPPSRPNAPAADPRTRAAETGPAPGRAGPSASEAASEAAGGGLSSAAGGATPGVAVVIVTWNRHDAAVAAIRSVLAQRGVDLGSLHLLVVDNASTDGTCDRLARWLDAERVVENPAARAEGPDFTVRPGARRNAVGLGSATLVRNGANLGGTGGFNTGLMAVERVLAPALPGPAGAAGGGAVEFLWLLDDDAEAHPDALARLLAAAGQEPDLGLVGSRAVDIGDRRTTFETTIYYDAVRGRMADTPHDGHRLRADHEAWRARAGGTRGRLAFTGRREVDVVSACSLLARRSVLGDVGYWDSRYFIYCDDADWCLRARAAGYRVACDLDAVVYHTPWFHKLTPARMYYSQRNAVWTMRKRLAGLRRRRSTARWLASILADALAAGLRRRLYHAEFIRRTAADIVANRGGALDLAEPPAMGLRDALAQADALGAGAVVVALCAGGDQAALADRARVALADQLRRAGRPQDMPRWVCMVRNDAADAGMAPGESLRAAAAAERVVYAPSLRSRLRRQAPVVRRRPAACLVFDQSNDVPLVGCPWTLHVDHRAPDRCRPERDSLGRRAAFVLRLSATAAACAWFVLRDPDQGPEARRG